MLGRPEAARGDSPGSGPVERRGQISGPAPAAAPNGSRQAEAPAPAEEHRATPQAPAPQMATAQIPAGQAPEALDLVSTVIKPVMRQAAPVVADLPGGLIIGLLFA